MVSRGWLDHPPCNDWLFLVRGKVRRVVDRVLQDQPAKLGHPGVVLRLAADL